MQQNQYGQTYSGNDDFRGWLSGNKTTIFDAGGNNGITADTLLQHVGNDASTGSTDPFITTAASNAYKAWQAGRDPYKQWGGQNNYSALVSGFNKQKEEIGTSAREAASQAASSLPLSIQDMVYNLTRNQQALDRKNVQNESSKIQGVRDIMSMVGQGVKSGGVTLANKNAGSSSASQAIANAYAQLGGKQMGRVNQQYATNADNIAVEQADQDYQRAQAPVKFQQQINDTINKIVTDARSKFAQLDASMAFSSLPDRINIEAEKEAIRQDALSKLQAFDQQFASQVGNIRTADRSTNIGKANELLATGQADPNLFNYSAQAPAQFQGTGPYASELPLFTYRRRA